MIVLVLAACPQGLRGHLTRWLFEVSAGVFVGKLNPRLRKHVWELVQQEVRGRALLVYPDRKAEQGFGFLSHGHDWEPKDIEGVTLMVRPSSRGTGSMRKGWSAASRYRRGKKR